MQDIPSLSIPFHWFVLAHMYVASSRELRVAGTIGLARRGVSKSAEESIVCTKAIQPYEYALKQYNHMSKVHREFRP